MSTRGAYGFRINGVDKLTYNHGDSYPSYLGSVMLQFIQNHSIDELREIAERITPVISSEHATAEQVAELSKYADLRVSSGNPAEWYVLLRAAQGDPEAWANGLNYYTDDSNFVYSSLFCEWAYIINLDEGVLEVYKGFNKDPYAPGRYASHLDVDDGYYGIALIDRLELKFIRKYEDYELAGVIDFWDRRE